MKAIWLGDPVKLAAYRIGLDEVSAALAEANENTAAGFFVENGQEYLIYGLGRVHSPEDIGQTLVALRAGVPVRVADLAEVRIGPAIKRGAGAANGRPAVVLAIQKQPGANTLALTARLDAVLAALQAGLPAGMVIETDLFRQADFIAVAIANVEAALRDGTVLVVLIVVAFLASLSATAITVLAIPLSLVAAVLVLEALGASINTMTLGGMAIAVGALVDDAIIDHEGAARHRRRGRLLLSGPVGLLPPGGPRLRLADAPLSHLRTPLRGHRPYRPAREAPGLPGDRGPGGVSPDRAGQPPAVTLFSRADGWTPQRLGAADMLCLTSVDFQIPVAALYEGVDLTPERP
jgi:hypothetical protein